VSLYNDVERILLTKTQIDERVNQIAKEIEKDYKDKNPILICILKGASVFFSDLIKKIDIPLEIEFMTVSSYRDSTMSSGKVDILQNLNCNISGRHVVVIEDIVDSGFTFKRLKKELEKTNAASIKLCALLDKLECRKTEVKAEYVGFVIPNVFVVGYGLDYAQKYRNMPDICVLKSCIYN